MCRGDVWGLRTCPDVIEYLPDVGTVRDKCDKPHLSTAHGAQQWEHLVTTGN